MNLQALYDLKERLEHAAIAGTGLLHEDFRLRRSLEALAPLAKANPVFAKICAGTASLLSAPEAERAGKLLDVLSLVDAVVYTQGVAGVAGDLLPLETGSGTYVQASYGQLQPLLTALGGTGSGRTTLIREYWKEHPAYFSDFRVLPHVVNALGDNYGELDELVAEILRQQGKGIIPRLKANFDPAGKTDMARRVRLIAKLAGEAENEWFCSILPDSKKDIREAVIHGLSLSKANSRLLLDLCQSERGKLKEAALRSLAAMDTEDAASFLKKEIQKKPKLIGCLKGVNSTLAADLAADALRAFLERLLVENQVYDQTDLEQLIMLNDVLCGKNSESVDSLWRWIAENMDAFAQIIPEKNVRSCDMSVAEHLQKTLMVTMIWSDEPALRNMAKALADSNRQWFLGCAMLADMAVISAGEVYDRYASRIVKSGILRIENAEQRNDRIQIMQALAVAKWNPELHRFMVLFRRFDPITGEPVTSGRNLDGVDPRWMKLLTDPGVNQDGSVYNLSLENHYRKVEPAMDWIISGLIDGDHTESCALAGKWLHQWIMKTGKITYYYDLIRCGWKNWRGLLVHCAKKNGEIGYPQVQSLLRTIPASNLEKAAELKDLDKLVESKKIKVQYGFWPQDSIQRQIAILESDPNAEI